MSDPFDQLRAHADAVEPPSDFTVALRRRIEVALGRVPTGPSPITPGGSVMAGTGTYIPPFSASVNAYLCVNDARRAIEWYREAFGAVVTYEPLIEEDGRVGHVELMIGDTVIALADEYPEYGITSPSTTGGSPVGFSLHVPDVEETFTRAVELGATADREVAEQFYGARAGSLHDPFGHRWTVMTWLGDDGHAAGQSPPYTGTTQPAAPPSTRAWPATQAQDLWNEVGYYVVNVPDLAPAKVFWGGLFGWAFEPDSDSPDGGTGAHVSNGIVPFGLHAGGEASTGLVHPYFRVRDLNDMTARVRELGGTVESIDQYASGGGAVCHDDQGVRFDLWQPADGY